MQTYHEEERVRKCKEKGSRVVDAEEEVTQLRITEAEEEEGAEMK